MPLIEWDRTGEKLYESGVSRGVFYVPGVPGVPWNGLISVNQSDEGGAFETFYFEGVAYYHKLQSSDFKATITAFTYPEAFEEYQGVSEISPGWYADDQAPPGYFGMSYRTNVGNDVDGAEHGYKIHLLYQLSAKPADASYGTLGDSMRPSTMSWDIKGVPQQIPNIRPSAHFILDSRIIPKYQMEFIENILYGDDAGVARLPSIPDLMTAVQERDKIIITDLNNGMWTADGPRDLVQEFPDQSFVIDEVNATYINPNTYNISSTPQGQ